MNISTDLYEHTSRWLAGEISKLKGPHKAKTAHELMHELSKLVTCPGELGKRARDLASEIPKFYAQEMAYEALCHADTLEILAVRYQERGDSGGVRAIAYMATELEQCAKVLDLVESGHPLRCAAKNVWECLTPNCEV